MGAATPKLTVQWLADTYAVCRLPADQPLPLWAAGSWWSATRTVEELSVVCVQGTVPSGVLCEGPWKCFKIRGPLAFEMTGVLAAVAAPLAAAGIPIFAVSTYDTDYVLVRQDCAGPATAALTKAGHTVIPEQSG